MNSFAYLIKKHRNRKNSVGCSKIERKNEAEIVNSGEECTHNGPHQKNRYLLVNMIHIVMNIKYNTVIVFIIFDWYSIFIRSPFLFVCAINATRNSSRRNYPKVKQSPSKTRPHDHTTDEHRNTRTQTRIKIRHKFSSGKKRTLVGT